LTCIFQFDTFLNKLGALGYQFAHKTINSKKKRSLMTKKKKEKKPLLNRVATCTLKIIIEELKNKVFFSSNDSQSNEVVTPYHLK